SREGDSKPLRLRIGKIQAHAPLCACQIAHLHDLAVSNALALRRRQRRLFLPTGFLAARGAAFLAARAAPAAATQAISTRYCGAASLASTVARAGVSPLGIHDSHSPFI